MIRHTAFFEQEQCPWSQKGKTLKISQIQNEFMKTPFLSKYEQKYFKEFCPSL